MKRRKSRGLSLVELIMFIVIVGAAVAGIIGVIDVTTRSSADPMIRKQALAIAEAMMEEVRLQAFTYCDPDDPAAATADATGASTAFRAAALAGTTTTTLTINKPAGTVQNDVMVASIGFRPNCCDTPAANYGITPPAGWTALPRLDNAPGAGILPSNSLAVYWKLAGASEPATYQWSFSVSGGATFNAAAGGILTFSGVEAVAPVVGVEESGRQTTAGDQTTPSITTAAANTMLVTSHSYASPSTAPWTAPSGMTPAVDVKAGAQSTAIFYGVQAVAGPTGTKQAVPTPDDDIGNAHILALKPAAGGCPVLAEAIGPEAGETRYSSTLPFDNVNDYHGFDSNTAVPSGIRNIDGTLIAGLEGYRITVSVAGQTLGGIGNDANGNPQSLLISVTVTGPGNTTVTLNGYRARYAPNALP